MKKLMISLIFASLASTGFAASLPSNAIIIFNMSQKVMTVDYQICKTVATEPFSCSGTITADIDSVNTVPANNFKIITLPSPSADYSVAVVQAATKDNSAKTVFTPNAGVTSCTASSGVSVSLSDMHGSSYVTCVNLNM